MKLIHVKQLNKKYNSITLLNYTIVIQKYNTELKLHCCPSQHTVANKKYCAFNNNNVRQINNKEKLLTCSKLESPKDRSHLNIAITNLPPGLLLPEEVVDTELHWNTIYKSIYSHK